MLGVTKVGETIVWVLRQHVAQPAGVQYALLYRYYNTMRTGCLIESDAPYEKRLARNCV